MAICKDVCSHFEPLPAQPALSAAEVGAFISDETQITRHTINFDTGADYYEFFGINRVV
jgi:hypothetical protein